MHSSGRRLIEGLGGGVGADRDGDKCAGQDWVGGGSGDGGVKRGSPGRRPIYQLRELLQSRS